MMNRPSRLVHWIAMVTLSLVLGACASRADGPRIEVTAEPDRHRVTVQVDGEPFTSYLFDDRREELAKPVLYPMYAPGGASVTRGYPIDPRPGERVDHPHHIGHWLNYGDVNGLDFWNNSGNEPEDERGNFGHIVHREITGVKSGMDQGVLEVQMDWRAPDDQTLMQEETRFVFRAGSDWRTIDRITRLTAIDARVALTDNKEGFFAIRVARELEHPADGPTRIVGDDGTPVEEPVEHNEGVSGEYLSADGVTGMDVWGTRSPWMLLRGTIDGDPVGVAIFDHPENVGHPTYWHARGYGLFSANPLGQAVFSEGEEQLDYALEPGQSVTFRYRIFIHTGGVSVSTLQSEYEEWSRTTPSLAEASAE